MGKPTSVIKDIEIRACTTEKQEFGEDWSNSKGLNFAVITMTDHDGVKGTSFGFGALDSTIAGKAMSAIKPFFIGRDAFDTERSIREFENFDRKWNHVPIYAYGPFDNACWDIKGKIAGLPVYKMLGAAREEVPVYVSSGVLESVDAYVAEALEVKGKGYKGYKLHPPGMVEGGKMDMDIEAYRAVRKAVGPDFPLMADPVIGHNYEEALKVGRELEKLNFLWLEEPVLDVDFTSLRKLREKLDIPIIATEVLAGANYSTAMYIKEGIVDIVRSDVSWRGGITAVMKTAHVAEAFGVQCELHTTIYHALEMVQVHASLAIPNCQFFELCYPTEPLDFGTKHKLDICDGMISAPKGVGFGIEYDWDYIEDHTIAIY
jgi:L-alanine-DL-glutamate epimerase-like enolase superfamily enzyme